LRVITTRARAEAWCLLIHAEASLSIEKREKRHVYDEALPEGGGEMDVGVQVREGECLQADAAVPLAVL